MPGDNSPEGTDSPKFRFVAVGPWDGWTEEEIYSEIFAAPPKSFRSSPSTKRTSKTSLAWTPCGRIPPLPTCLISAEDQGCSHDLPGADRARSPVTCRPTRG